MDSTKLLQTQEDDPTQHVMVEGKFAISPEEFQAILDAAPVEDLTDGHKPIPESLKSYNPSKVSDWDAHLPEI
jgi:hypothetical protein